MEIGGLQTRKWYVVAPSYAFQRYRVFSEVLTILLKYKLQSVGVGVILQKNLAFMQAVLQVICFFILRLWQWGTLS